jgi:D-aminoacyl-tRNA deacylase
MRIVLQRVREASVAVDGVEKGAIGPGLLVLLGVQKGDDEAAGDRLADRVCRLRLFEDEQGKMNRSLLDVAGQALVISQFTLCADARRGLRPSFEKAEEPGRARLLYERFADRVRAAGVGVATGVFGARMAVRLENDGPVTIVLDSAGDPAGPCPAAKERAYGDTPQRESEHS